MKGGLSNFHVKGDVESNSLSQSQDKSFETNNNQTNQENLKTNESSKNDDNNEINPKYKLYLFLLLFFLGKYF